MTLKLGIQHQVLEPYNGCTNDNHALTLTFLWQDPSCSLMILWEDLVDFVEIIEVYELKVGT